MAFFSPFCQENKQLNAVPSMNIFLLSVSFVMFEVNLPHPTMLPHVCVDSCDPMGHIGTVSLVTFLNTVVSSATFSTLLDMSSSKSYIKYSEMLLMIQINKVCRMI